MDRCLCHSPRQISFLSPVLTDCAVGDGCSFSFPRAGGLLLVHSVVLPGGAVVGRPGPQVPRLHEPREGPHVGSCERGAALCCVAVVVLAKPHSHGEWSPSSCSRAAVQVFWVTPGDVWLSTQGKSVRYMAGILSTDQALYLTGSGVNM